MKYYLGAAIVAAASAFAAVPAAAVSEVSIVTTDCISVSDVDGCLFNGNIAPNTVADTQSAYNDFLPAFPDAPITLNYITQSDDGNFGTFGSITGGTGKSGTWSLPGYTVDFIAVKAGNQFVLYKLAQAASSGTWDTFDIVVGGRNNPQNPNLSHVAFFGSEGGVVPEPATWAMMIAGFGLVGGALRRRTGMARVSA